MAYSPKRALAELRHSGSIGTRAASSPRKRDEDSSPLIHDHEPANDHIRHSSRDRERPFWSHLSHIICPFLSDDPRVSQHSSKIYLLLLAILVMAGLGSVFSIVNRLVSTQTSVVHAAGTCLCISTCLN